MGCVPWSTPSTMKPRSSACCGWALTGSSRMRWIGFRPGVDLGCAKPDRVRAPSSPQVARQPPSRYPAWPPSRYSMIIRSLLVATLLATSALAVPALAQSGASAPVPAQVERDRMFAIFAADDEASLKRNPISALFRGDMRYADRLGDFGSDAYYKAERAAAEKNLADLGTINRAKLNATDQIAYDVYAWNQRKALERLSPEILALTAVRPINHFFGIHTFYPSFASGKGAAPFKTTLDYDNNIKRHANFATIIDQAIARFKQGQASGVVETKLTINNVIAQLDLQLAMPLEESPYWGPARAIPASFTDAEKNRVTTALRQSLTQEVMPALTRLRDHLKTSYLADAREGLGLLHMKGGERLYELLIEGSTTLKMSAGDIHELGLREVARIRAEMTKVQAEVAFKGSLADFFEHLRTDPKFKPSSREALTQGYVDIGKKVDAEIGSYFSTLPKAALEIRPYEEFREKFEAGGSYNSGTPDGKRPGVFYFNAYDLPSRTTPGMITLYLHEGAPGHHFQISLAQENEALPAFMRFGGNTAYIEGWALYAETLGYDMGLYKDPYARIGTLSDEMLRAMRLVVDTGIHAKGWSRDKAIDYMMANSDMGRTDVTAEVERYIAVPSQALAYKVGALTVQRLRKKAETTMGSKFDIRAFHDQILGTGALPLPVLEDKINRWITKAI
ncbi:DUF885 domain-containing protein [Ideonella sp.]|uniref:DUF885 domain-containing protein n=1 Tax=Ideonella sp. TaxID=1929293 RepID=UPI0037C0963C